MFDAFESKKRTDTNIKKQQEIDIGNINHIIVAINKQIEEAIEDKKYYIISKHPILTTDGHNQFQINYILSYYQKLKYVTRQLSDGRISVDWSADQTSFTR